MLDTAYYRANYDVDGWEKLRATQGEVCVPFGAILAINTLCAEVERLQAMAGQAPRDAKRCTYCGGHHLVELRTSKHEAFDKLGYRHCADCGADMPWHLDEGQPPLIGSNRAGRRPPAA